MAVPKALREFAAFARDFRTVQGWCVKLSFCGPLLDLLAHVGPPYPSRAAFALVTSIIQTIVLMVVFEAAQGRAGGIRRMRRFLWVGVSAFAVALLLYLALFTLWIRPAEGWFDKHVIGFEYVSGDIGEMVARAPHQYTPSELLLRFHNPEAIWSGRSLAVTRWSIMIGWILLWGSMATSIGAFVQIQRMRTARKRD